MRNMLYVCGNNTHKLVYKIGYKFRYCAQVLNSIIDVRINYLTFTMVVPNNTCGLCTDIEHISNPLCQAYTHNPHGLLLRKLNEKYYF